MSFPRDDENTQEFTPPHSVKDALRKYSERRHYPPPNAWPEESPLFAVLHAPGRATNGSQDGGMAARMDRMGRAFAWHAWILETRSRLLLLPQELHAVVVATYEVPQREEPRSDRAVAEKLGIARLEVIKRLERAYGWLSREMGLPAH